MKVKRKTRSSQPTEQEIIDPDKRINTKYPGLVVTGDDNWLLVKKTNEKVMVSVSKYIRAKNISFKTVAGQTREYFTMMDWPYENVELSVLALADNRSRFAEIEYNRGAVLEYDYRSGFLTVLPANIKVKAGFNPQNTLPDGTYNISLPDAPHAGGEYYLNLTRYAKHWLAINDDDELNRYLHPGRVSLGCLTVGLNAPDPDAEIRNWTRIMDFLLVQRLAGNKYIGKLTIKNFASVADQIY